MKFSEKLKQATAVAHSQLEDQEISKALLSKEISLKDYCTYLQLMQGLLQSAENQVFPLLSNQLKSNSSRKKAYLIQEDLNFLGWKEESLKEPQVYFDQEYSEAFAFGIAYVFEGSTLGGRMIYKHVEDKLALTANSGASYFFGYGEKTGMMWKEFLEALNSFESENQQGDAIIAGAKHAFLKIKDTFQSAAHLV
ncbi:biliverdin-producing heme oxygenase [Algoriphagus pacificus]|uniref:Biliverdin-producing heme oxygenase n=1 Tax=Algoriphagus pacificus TaxID=2811234 RepID=A0ABS3CGT8_9BACT|nr:biliverdin-producing heme oxygenase [Algoriphagus pacificus]MBN7816303.1 biliverdin-producing heme oxygenase [Algoriphagus pacificus]